MFRTLKKNLVNICLPQKNGSLGLCNGQSGQPSLVMIVLVKTLVVGDGEDCCGDHGDANHDGDGGENAGADAGGDDDDGGRGDEDRGDDVSRRCGSRST